MIFMPLPWQRPFLLQEAQFLTFEIRNIIGFENYISDQVKIDEQINLFDIIK